MRAFLDQALLPAVESRPASRVLRALERVDARRSGLLRVLTYHRVAHPEAAPDLAPGLVSATPAEFDRQMRFLAAEYRVVSMEEALQAFRRRKDEGGRMKAESNLLHPSSFILHPSDDLPPRAVLLTFDDAYEDFEQHAWPILKRYGLPVTLFVPTAYPDAPERSFWWDRLHAALRETGAGSVETPLGMLPLRTAEERTAAYGSLNGYLATLPHGEVMALVERICAASGGPPARNRVLGWNALRALAREGVTLAAHTQTHPLLNRVSPAEAQREAGGSRDDLERETGAALPVFSYPGGAYSDAVVRAVANAGFELAFTTEYGMNDPSCDHPLRLRRVNVGRRSRLGVLRARLLSWGSGVQAFRRSGVQVFRR
jgi:peptidoglycan/xylan/chitin deacetylase (PgdA/CDA1 family)